MGPDSELSPGDWLAVLLNGADSEGRGDAHPVREHAARHGLRELAQFSTAELVEDLGLELAAARRLVAAFALGRLVLREARSPRIPLHAAARVHAWVWPDLAGLERERFIGLYLDSKHRLRHSERISEGTLTASLVHPREVYRPAIRCAAAAVIVVHNHPSGDPEPSSEDIEVTRRLREAGRIVGIPLLDHVIAAEGGFVSLRERMGF